MAFRPRDESVPARTRRTWKASSRDQDRSPAFARWRRLAAGRSTGIPCRTLVFHHRLSPAGRQRPSGPRRSIAVPRRRNQNGTVGDCRQPGSSRASLLIGVPSAFVLSARGQPAIHDITTDPDNPPAFVAILPLRTGAANPPEYGGGVVAAQQRRAYPDIQPLTLRVRKDEAFDRALAAVRALGWDVVADDRQSGRIEAVDTTFWFGFKDDVVIRIAEAPANGGTRVDVRSKSRVGRRRPRDQRAPHTRSARPATVCLVT